MKSNKEEMKLERRLVEEKWRVEEIEKSLEVLGSPFKRDYYRKRSKHCFVM